MAALHELLLRRRGLGWQTARLWAGLLRRL
jgi:hypothetical protein